MNDAAADYDRNLIAKARELANADSTEKLRPLVEELYRDESRELVRAAAMGKMQAILRELADGYERELARNA